MAGFSRDAPEIPRLARYKLAAAKKPCVSRRPLAHTFSHMLDADTEREDGAPRRERAVRSDMSGECAVGPDWTVVDEGWGRKAVDFATLSEPGNCREYAALHHMLGVGDGDSLLDVACGAGLAIELASVRGADYAGIDASARLVAAARDRSPRADIRETCRSCGTRASAMPTSSP
jgi:SAM-dependent methyltransferase